MFASEFSSRTLCPSQHPSACDAGTEGAGVCPSATLLSSPFDQGEACWAEGRNRSLRTTEGIFIHRPWWEKRRSRALSGEWTGGRSTAKGPLMKPRAPGAGLSSISRVALNNLCTAPNAAGVRSAVGVQGCAVPQGECWARAGAARRGLSHSIHIKQMPCSGCSGGPRALPRSRP